MKDIKIANKRIEGCSTSLVNRKREPPGDTTTNPPKWLQLQKLQVPNIGEDLKQLEFSNIVSNQNGTAIWKVFWQFLIKLNMCLL